MTQETFGIELVARQPTAAALAAWVQQRRHVLVWWAVSRVLVFAAAFALHLVGGPLGFFPRKLLASPFGVLTAWDGKWYALVAARGYLLVPGRQSDVAFFPGLPLLLALAHHAEVPIAAAALVVANAAFLTALLVFYDLTRAVLGRDVATRASVLMAVFPQSFVFSMAYPQSLVLAATAGAALLALRGRWTSAAVTGGAGALCRPEGVFVAIPLAALAWSRRRELSASARGPALASIAAPAAGLAAFPLYLGWLLHDPFAWSHAQRAWGRAFGAAGPLHAVEHVPAMLAQNPALVRDVVSCALYVALLAYGLRTPIPRSWLAAGATVVLLPIFSGSFESEARFGLLALPLFWALAFLLGPRATRLAVPVSAALLVVGVVTLPYVFP